jgi:PAS domain S-box-containing protein
MAASPQAGPIPDFRALFESAPGLYLVLAPDLTIIAVSDAYLHATLTRREGILGRGLFEVFTDNPGDRHASGVNKTRASMARVLQLRRPDAMAVQQHDIRRPASEGGGIEERYWAPLNSPVLNADGDIEYIIHQLEDVTEFVRLGQRDREQEKDTKELRWRAEQIEEAHRQPLRTHVWGMLILFGLISAVLLALGRKDYPNLHRILDTSSCLLSAVLALLFWDMGVRTRRSFPRYLAISFVVTSLLETMHLLVTVEWSGLLTPIAQAVSVWQPATWLPAAHILAVGIGCSVWLTHQEGQKQHTLEFVGALIVISVALFAVCRWLPPITPPTSFGITRPTLILAPLLWAVVGAMCWRLRASDRLLRGLALIAAILFLAQLSMLYSRAPHDTQSMVAHMGKVAGYLVLVLTVMQMASSDMLERIRAEGALARLNEELERRVEDRTAELRTSYERTRAIMDTALDGVIVMDHEGRIREFNPAAERIFGFRRSDVVGQPLADAIVPPASREPHRLALSRYLGCGEAKILGRRIELAGLCAGGGEVPLELSINRMPGDGPPLFAGFVRDLTQRRQAEIKVHKQMARLALLNQITHAIGERQDTRSIFQVVVGTLEQELPVDFSCICLHDPVDNTLTVTSVGLASAVLAMELALTEEAHIPMELNGLSRCMGGQLVYEPDISLVPFPLPERLAKGGLRSMVAAPLRVESQVFGVLLAARAQLNGFTSGDCEFLEQLSEHVALAAHQAQLYGALQKAYDELRDTRQAVIQQERLRALGQMASGIAHDINNAISPIALYTESLLEREPNLSPDARRYLETIQRAIDDVARTVARMREFYLERESQLTLLPVDLNRLIQQVIDLTRARWGDMAQRRGISIQMQTELAPQLPDIMGAENEIREALTNLVFNAVDAMPQGGTLKLRTVVGEDARRSQAIHSPQRVYLEVIDTGVGMDEDTRRRCLEPFFTTKGERGTGLGLAMVYGAVQRHSADIEIESAPGRGTTVRLSFAIPSVEVAGATESTGTYAMPSPLRILIVDDDPVLLKSVQDTLEADGHDVTVTHGGEAGIDAFRAAHERGKSFDIVMTDLGMPYIDGRKVASAVKALAPSMPVILLTGWGQRLVTENDIPPHVDRVLSKPPKLRALREALAELTAAGARRARAAG